MSAGGVPACSAKMKAQSPGSGVQGRTLLPNTVLNHVSLFLGGRPPYVQPMECLGLVNTGGLERGTWVELLVVSGCGGCEPLRAGGAFCFWWWSWWWLGWGLGGGAQPRCSDLSRFAFGYMSEHCTPDSARLWVSPPLSHTRSVISKRLDCTAHVLSARQSSVPHARWEARAWQSA